MYNIDDIHWSLPIWVHFFWKRKAWHDIHQSFWFEGSWDQGNDLPVPLQQELIPRRHVGSMARRMETNGQWEEYMQQNTHCIPFQSLDVCFCFYVFLAFCQVDCSCHLCQRKGLVVAFSHPKPLLSNSCSAQDSINNVKRAIASYCLSWNSATCWDKIFWAYLDLDPNFIFHVSLSSPPPPCTVVAPYKSSLSAL